MTPALLQDLVALFQPHGVRRAEALGLRFRGGGNGQMIAICFSLMNDEIYIADIYIYMIYMIYDQLHMIGAFLKMGVFTGNLCQCSECSWGKLYDKLGDLWAIIFPLMPSTPIIWGFVDARCPTKSSKSSARSSGSEFFFWNLLEDTNVWLQQCHKPSPKSPQRFPRGWISIVWTTVVE